MPSAKIDESALTKGQVRKLNALRKSIGDQLGEEAFVKWLSAQPKETAEPVDNNAVAIQDALEKLVLKGTIKIPRGGYLIRRGRGRLIVERPAD